MKKSMLQLFVMILAGAGLVSVAYTATCLQDDGAQVIVTASSVGNIWCQNVGRTCQKNDTCYEFQAARDVDCTKAGDTSCRTCVYWELWYDTQDDLGNPIEDLQESYPVGGTTTLCGKDVNFVGTTTKYYRCVQNGWSYHLYGMIWNSFCPDIDYGNPADTHVVDFSLP